jgi:alpha-galactosidase
MHAFTIWLLSAFVLSSAQAYNNGLGRTPPMGWNSWCTDSLCNLFGKDPCSETLVKETVDSIVANGLDKLGYNYVALDDCWSDTKRDENGHLQPEAKKFPNGMKALADYVHSKGLYFGLYTSVGDETCKGKRPGSLGHFVDDAKTLTSWGVDMIKMDHCGHKNGTDPELYGAMSKALNATGRPVLFSLCNWGEDNVWEWGSSLAQMYRIQMDHLPFWKFGNNHSSDGVGYGQGTYDIIEWMGHLQPSKWTKQFGWMDPDFLMTEYFTMDFIASRTEFTFWSLWSSPLLISTDLRKLSSKKREIIGNKEVIAINQDPSNTGGDRILNDTEGRQVWARDLVNGDKCVVLYNSGNGRSHRKKLIVKVTWDMIGWGNTGVIVEVRDLWKKETLGNFSGGYNSSIAVRDVQMIRLRRYDTTYGEE